MPLNTDLTILCILYYNNHCVRQCDEIDNISAKGCQYIYTYSEISVDLFTLVIIFVNPLICENEMSRGQ